MHKIILVKLENVRTLLSEQGYVTDNAVSMAVFLSMSLEKPLLIEGPAGVGKTEVAKAMAAAMQTDLIQRFRNSWRFFQFYHAEILHEMTDLFTELCIQTRKFFVNDRIFFFKIRIVDIQV